MTSTAASPCVTSLSEVHRILHHLTCDVFLLTDDTCSEDELERLYLLPEEVEPPALLSLTRSCAADHGTKRV
jgi:hypothetical protein